MIDGDWHLVWDGDPRAFGHPAHCSRIRVAAYMWGQANGYRVRSKSVHGGAKFYVQFTKGLAPWKKVKPPWET